MQFSLTFAPKHKVARISLREALRTYWKHLVPIAMLPTIIFLVVGSIQKPWAFWMMVPFFYGCGFYAIVPCTRRDAPCLFWVIACVTWILGAVPGVLIFAAFKAFFR